MSEYLTALLLLLPHDDAPPSALAQLLPHVAACALLKSVEEREAAALVEAAGAHCGEQCERLLPRQLAKLLRALANFDRAAHPGARRLAREAEADLAALGKGACGLDWAVVRVGGLAGDESGLRAIWTHVLRQEGLAALGSALRPVARQRIGRAGEVTLVIRCCAAEWKEECECE